MIESKEPKKGKSVVTGESLRKSEDRYYKMIDEVQDYAIILLNEDGIIQNWNKGAQQIKGYQEKEIIGKHFSMFYLPEDRASGLPGQLLKKAAEEGRALHEGWRMRKDGTRFWGIITLTALHNEQGDVIGYSKVTRDMTERKMAEDQQKQFAADLQAKNEALRSSEERYHKMVAEVKDYAIIMLDVDGNIQNWNTGAQNIKGYTANEIIGKNFNIFYSEEDRRNNQPQRLLREAAETGRAVHEGWRVTKQGTKFWGSIVITALHAEDGSLIGFSKVTRDLTEKKRADDRLNEYLHELEVQNEELDRFAYAASHDLQEPLRKIRTFADLLEKNLGNSEAATKYLEKITTASYRMTQLIHSILEYSQMSKNGMEKTETDLNEILGNVLNDYELLIQEKKASITYEKLPTIRAIPLQINQLFSNLISNAIKFNRQDPKLHISSKIVDADVLANLVPKPNKTKYHQIVFTDNGIGFDQKHADLIFTLFQRLHGKHEFSGTGIGLSLCKKIMDNHLGYIYAESTPDNGASFYIYFSAE